MADLHDLTALEQGALVRRGEVSSRELVDHYLERADRLDTVGAFVTLTPEQARSRAADAADAAAASGPLAGVPTAVKDLNLTAGVRTTFGSAAYDDFVPEESDGVVLAMEAAGLVSLGKTSTPEFGSPCYTEPDGRPPAVTPWDRTRMAGGSSGGAAAAVAAGLVPLAQGSDGGGSIRIPASCCGLVGLKPSRGRISGAPMYGDPIGLATAGPIARTVRDAAALLDVLAGRRPGDPSWAPAPAGTFLAACDRPPGRLRVARFVAPVIADVEVDPASVQAWEDASRLLASLGHEVEDVEVPLPREAVPVFETCWAVLTAMSTAPEGREHLLRPLTRWLSERGRAVSGPELGLAIGGMRRFAAQALTALAPYDLVLTPTLAAPPLPVGALRDDADPAADFEAQKRFTPWTSAWNVTGMPAVSLPLHWTDDELPVGVMLAARPAEEELLLAAAAQVEEAAPWAHRRPPGW
ncbi:amidase [Nocardioides sp. zg-579]|uniref:Amidase n=1 Tax=Nocardioides marmotae TaxID=2663857 RepID=A0A6I3JGB1_9ACTN|nr:amidase [Nocardioides marmotae]MCR6033513.1 amidase [Gordonia jinghuaiqii]MTB97171.1 amidase [Nocardioides marmotae]